MPVIDTDWNIPELSQVSPLRDGDADVLRAYAGKVVLDAHQLGRVWVRQRVQQRGVDHAIDRGGGSDAQRHGGDRNERESRRSQKHANRVPQVEEQILDEGKALLGVVVFPYRFGRAKLECGLPPRLGGRHTGAQILLRLEREMFGDLFLQALVGTPPCREIGKANQEASQEFHGKSSALTLKKRAMIAAVCSQSRVSAWSCLRPAPVRR